MKVGNLCCTQLKIQMAEKGNGKGLQYPSDRRDSVADSYHILGTTYTRAQPIYI